MRDERCLHDMATGFGLCGLYGVRLWELMAHQRVTPLRVPRWSGSLNISRIP